MAVNGQDAMKLYLRHPVDVVVTADWLDDPMNPGDTVLKYGIDMGKVANHVACYGNTEVRNETVE